jgi:hypothetical protein
VAEPIDRDDLVGPDEQECEQRALAPATQRQRVPVSPYRKRPQDPKIELWHGGSGATVTEVKEPG